MKNYFDEIEKKLRMQIKFESLEIVDNSHKHKGHKFFSEEKFHLHLKIKSLYLSSISRLSAQKLIMKVLKDDLKFLNV
jgi:stress-induced morphogen